MATRLYNKRVVIVAVSVLLVAGFLLTSLASYHVSRRSLRDAIGQTELPLTADNIYSEIQRDLLRPVLISSLMANDTFLRDWVQDGELEQGAITRYLSEIKLRYNTITSFFVSERSRNYYFADGVLKTVRENDPRDVWYFRVRDMKAEYEINLDPDEANRDTLTIFINYRLADQQGGFLGVTGVGLTVDAVRRMIDDYQRRFQRTVYFVDRQGVMAMVGRDGSVPEHSITNRGNLGSILPQLSEELAQSFQYTYRGEERLLSTRFIRELGWYLFVEKSDDAALSDVRETLYLNLLISAIITVLVLIGARMVISRYQGRLEEMATTDRLTGLVSRNAYDMLMAQALKDAQRRNRPVSAVMLDVDRFKLVNDTYGHLQGDRVLRGVAQAMRASLRASDIVCRWGGDEFLVLLRDCDLVNAERIAETIRAVIEEAEFGGDGKHVNATVSIGIAPYCSGDNVDRLLSRADAALYAAKLAGRNSVRVAAEADAEHEGPPASPSA
ncbi:diguanylate cyclase [Ferrovibrio sp.]|uniref:sensor domain-containing diguanylate cyclase n=1 Tax=Ferrovibrio sp. TaxID=1917215 RepID=UPI0035AE2E57